MGEGGTKVFKQSQPCILILILLQPTQPQLVNVENSKFLWLFKGLKCIEQNIEFDKLKNAFTDSPET